MFVVMLRLVAQGLLGLSALTLLLWHGFFGVGWLAGVIPAVVLCALSNWVAATPDELANWREFCAKRHA